VRYATRQALLLRRNSIEAIFGQLKRRGLGARTHYKARWVDEPIQMEWLLGTALLGMTLRRDAHESGEYAKAAKLAHTLKLTKVEPRQPDKESPVLPWHRRPQMPRIPRRGVHDHARGTSAPIFTPRPKPKR
jgi:hypothetical protein